jgi:hypothetical protein
MTENESLEGYFNMMKEHSKIMGDQYQYIQTDI